jgi:glycosyltransferase involved in cell wall biosynthesis
MPEMPVILDTRVVTGTGGGPDKTILNSPRFLVERGYRMVCAYMHPPGDPGFEEIRRKAEAWGAPLLSVPDRGPWDLGVARRLLEVCRRERVAVWHGHDYKSNLLGLLLRPFWPMRLVTTVHGWVRHTRRTPLYYGIDRLCLPRFERVICVSEDLQRRSLACGVPSSRCLLIENGIDVAQFTRRRAPAEARARLGLEPGRPLIGAVGRLSPEKGFDLLIRALGRLRESGRDAGLVIAGEGDDRPRLETLIAELGLGDRVRLAGFVAETTALYEAMDVYALSSLREGLPNVLLEAMAMEVPVVATRIAGVPKLIHGRENGLLIEPGDVEGLAESLGRLLDDAHLRTSLAAAGRRTIEGRYSFGSRMDAIGQLYDTLLRGSERPVQADASPPRPDEAGAPAARTTVTNAVHP